MNGGESEWISAFVTAQKNDRLIVFGVADNQDESMENLTAMVKSLRLDVKVDEAAMMAVGVNIPLLPGCLPILWIVILKQVLNWMKLWQ